MSETDIKTMNETGSESKRLPKGVYHKNPQICGLCSHSTEKDNMRIKFANMNLNEKNNDSNFEKKDSVYGVDVAVVKKIE